MSVASVIVTSDLLVAFRATVCGRFSDCALQLEDGRYRRLGRPLDLSLLADHLRGRITLGTYVVNEWGACRFVVFDSDDRGRGLETLLAVQANLAVAGIVAHLELSRRGAHLWVFFQQEVEAAVARRWLLSYCPVGVEFYPRQDALLPGGYGSLIRVPLGVHQRTGVCYPFVRMTAAGLEPVAPSRLTMVRWLVEGAERVAVPVGELTLQGEATASRPANLRAPSLAGVGGEGNHSLAGGPPGGLYAVSGAGSPRTIAEWCALQDPFAVIGRYVDLDSQGMGHCPFGEHHDDGVDQHVSFRVYQPSRSGGSCWYCYTWGRGGNVFDFLLLYYGLDARTLWRKIRAGGVY